MTILFVNTDTSKDFMYKGWGLYVEKAEEIIPNLGKLTNHARAQGYKILHLGDNHTKESQEISETPDYRTTFPMHCENETEGAEFIPETKPVNPYMIHWKDKTFDENKVRENKEIILYKDAFDFYLGNPHSEKVIDAINPDKVVVYGVCTNVCVDLAIMRFLNRNKKLENKVQVYVPLDAIKELPNMPYQDVLDKWENNGVILTTTNKILEGKVL